MASRAIERFTAVGQSVLDPMSGSGTIAFAATRAGRGAVARDVDPLAVLLSQALCEPADVDSLAKYCVEIHVHASSWTARRRSARPLLASVNDEDKNFLRYWFSERVIIEMFALANAILGDPKNKFAVIGAVILSSLVISHTSGVSSAMDLARSRPHKVADKKIKNPLEFWKEKSKAFAKFYGGQHSVLNPIRADIAMGDARKLDIANDSIDAVITSPPYVNAIDYIRMSKFSLIFFGVRLEELREIRSTSIGSEVGLRKGDGLPEYLDKYVDVRVRDRARRPLLRRYLYDLRRTMVEALRVLKPGAPALFVLGPSIVSRKSYDSASTLSLIAKEIGFEVLGCSRRNLNNASRSLPAPNKAKRNQSIHRRMTCELYVALKKPAHD